MASYSSNPYFSTPLKFNYFLQKNEDCLFMQSNITTIFLKYAPTQIQYGDSDFIFFGLGELKRYSKLFWRQGEVGQLDHMLPF